MASGKTTTLAPALTSLLVERRQDEVVVLVTNYDESVAVAKLHVTEHRQSASTFCIMSYAQFRAILERDIATPSQKKLAPRITIIIDFDPWFTADFALAIILLGPWAKSARTPRSAIRLLTMSYEAPHPRVSALLEPYVPSPPRLFELPAETSANPTGDLPATAVSEVVSHNSRRGIWQSILEEIRSSPVRDRHLVIAFSPLVVVERLRKECENDENISVGTRILDDHLVSSAVHITHDAITTPDKRVLIVYVDAGKAPMVPITGFAHVHIICGDGANNVAYSPQLGTLATKLMFSTKSDQLNQLSWKARVDSSARVCIHLLAAIQEWFGTDGDYVDPGLEMDNRQLPGFLCSLASFSDFGIDTGKVMGIIARENPMAIHRALERLYFQGLLVGELQLDLRKALPPLRLEEGRKRLLLDLLPAVRFDARLAALLITPSPSPHIALLKVQLAALLTVGEHRLFSLEVLIGQDSSDLHASLPRAGCGFARPIASTGTWWMIIALWNKLVIGHVDFKPELGQAGMMSVSVHLEKEQLSLNLDFPTGVLMTQCTNNLSEIMRKHGVDVTDAADQKNTETDLGEAAYNDLRLSLLKSFAHDLVAAHEPIHGATGTAVLSTYPLQFTAGVHQMIDVRSLSGEMGFGVTGRLRIEGHDNWPLCDQWTWIPMRILEKWLADEHNGANPFHVIAM